LSKSKSIFKNVLFEGELNSSGQVFKWALSAQWSGSSSRKTDMLIVSFPMEHDN